MNAVLAGVEAQAAFANGLSLRLYRSVTGNARSDTRERPRQAMFSRLPLAQPLLNELQKETVMNNIAFARSLVESRRPRVLPIVMLTLAFSACWMEGTPISSPPSTGSTAAVGDTSAAPPNLNPDPCAQVAAFPGWEKVGPVPETDGAGHPTVWYAIIPITRDTQVDDLDSTGVVAQDTPIITEGAPDPEASAPTVVAKTLCTSPKLAELRWALVLGPQYNAIRIAALNGNAIVDAVVVVAPPTALADDAITYRGVHALSFAALQSAQKTDTSIVAPNAASTGGSPSSQEPTGTAGAPPASPTGVEAFLGTWTYTSGTFTLACGGEPGVTAPVPTRSITFRAGPAADQVTVVDDGGCEVPCTVKGNVAIGAVGSTCAADDQKVSSLRYILSGDVLREVGATTGTVNGESCQVSDDALLTHG